MINILKLRKLEKENNNQKLEENNEPIEELSKESVLEKKRTKIPAQKIKTPKKISQKKGKNDTGKKKKKETKVEQNISEESVKNNVVEYLAAEKADIPVNTETINNYENPIVLNEKVSSTKINKSDEPAALQESNNQIAEEDDDPQEKLRLSLLNELLIETKENSSINEEKEIKTRNDIEEEKIIDNVIIPEEKHVEERVKVDGEKLQDSEQSNVEIEKQTLIEAEKNKKAAESIIHLVGFNLSNEYYGVDIMMIREIIRMTEITRVPKAPDFVEGVINLRGSVIPVVNLRTKIKMPRKEYDKSTRIIVIELKNMVIGFIVDSVREVLRIPSGLLAPPPDFTVNKNSEYITAVAKLDDRLLILMDPEKILTNQESKTLASK